MRDVYLKVFLSPWISKYSLALVKALADGTIDANYFQHTPYLDDFNAENNTHIVSVAAIHVEPMGLYGGKQTTLDALSAK